MMEVFGDLVIDPSHVQAASVAPTADHMTTEEIGMVVLHEGPRIEVSAESARKLIAHFRAKSPEPPSPEL